MLGFNGLYPFLPNLVGATLARYAVRGRIGRGERIAGDKQALTALCRYGQPQVPILQALERFVKAGESLPAHGEHGGYVIPAFQGPRVKRLGSYPAILA